MPPAPKSTVLINDSKIDNPTIQPLTSKEREAALDAALKQKDSRDLEEAVGKDLEFDVDAFIRQGTIAKQGIRIADDILVDMKTLSRRERMVAEMLVRENFGSVKMDQLYYNALDTAILTVAITKVNNKAFPVPNVLDQRAPEFAAQMQDKRDLFKTLMDSSDSLIDALAVLYANLDKADFLTEDTKKKSEKPGEVEPSGSSVVN